MSAYFFMWHRSTVAPEVMDVFFMSVFMMISEPLHIDLHIYRRVFRLGGGGGGGGDRNDVPSPLDRRDL
jgi:hypothetical protein